MRGETEMLNLILAFAKNHDDIRAVVLSGSKTNPNLPYRDMMQDYDVVYLVRDVTPYQRSPEIPAYFGEIMILQTPDDMCAFSDAPAPEPPPAGHYAYLMQFMDGTRIDLSFYPIGAAQRCREDSLSVVLLDKDGLLGELPPPSDAGYLPKPPSAHDFAACCNEFWWLNPYVAKGLWRDELPYARYMLDTLMREQLHAMLTWDLGVASGFKHSPGKLGKYFKLQLEPELWALLERTYAGPQLDETWEALLAMGELFRRAALAVANACGFTYPAEEDARVSAYIRRIRAIPARLQTQS